jgi:hypothetical protein
MKLSGALTLVCLALAAASPAAHAAVRVTPPARCPGPQFS